MMRLPLTLSVLTGFLNLGQVVGAANPPLPKLSKLERTAQHIFQLADADKSGSLNPAEQAQADVRSEKAIRQLVHDNTIGGQTRLPAVDEPAVADPAAMTGPEFTQHFEALAASKDAALRACRMAKNQPPVMQPSVGQPPVFATVSERGRDRDDGDRYRGRRRDRDERYDSSPLIVYQPHPQQHFPQPVFSPPLHHDLPAPTHVASGGKQESVHRQESGGGRHEAEGIHQPAHGHDSSKGDSHGHGGHQGK